LEGEEQAALRALVRRHLRHVVAVEKDPSFGDLVGRVPHDRVGERALAGAVRPHHRVHLVQADLEVDALDDRCAVLQSDVHVLKLQQSH
jgi:hypothetical protein